MSTNSSVQLQSSVGEDSITKSSSKREPSKRRQKEDEKDVTAAANADDKEMDDSYSLDETGDSTKSLLSVLSHSSIDDLSTGSLADSSSKSSSPSKTNTDSHLPTNQLSETFSKSTTSNPAEPVLSPWEKWVVKKTEAEREQIQEDVRRKMEEVKAKEAEEKRKRERRKVIEGRVREWIKDKDKSEKKKKQVEMRRHKQEQMKKMEEEARITEKAKASRETWMEKKQEEEERKKQKAKEERMKKAAEQMERKQQADEAYQKWKKEAKTRPKPLTGSFHGKGHFGDSSYPVPSYSNPLPWIPIHVPSSSEKAGKLRNGKKLKKGISSSSKQVLSPPLLYKDRSSNNLKNVWGRRR